jgi:hypothetical protein
MARTGRPPKEIDQKQFENLCGLQCTLEEICGWFDVCSDTLETWCKRTYERSFSEVFAQKRGAGKISLRRSQWRLAEKNATMAIFLGKQFLGQRDNVDVNVTNNDGMPLDELETMVIGFDAGSGDSNSPE